MVRRPGSDKWEDISWDDAIAKIAQHIKDDARPVLRREEREGPDRQPQPRHRHDRRLHGHERVQLPAVEGERGPGGAVPGHPGTGMTRPHGGQFGRHVRARSDDERMGRHQERRRRPRHGREPRREPSLRLQVGRSRPRRRVTRRSSRSTRASRARRPSPTSTAPIRAGTDIAFLSGIIRYAIEKKRFHEDYVKLHTNAPVPHRRQVRVRRRPLLRLRRRQGRIRQERLGLRGRREDEGLRASTRRSRTRAASSSS